MAAKVKKAAKKAATKKTTTKRKPADDALVLPFDNAQCDDGRALTAATYVRLDEDRRWAAIETARALHSGPVTAYAGDAALIATAVAVENYLRDGAKTEQEN